MTTIANATTAPVDPTVDLLDVKPLTPEDVRTGPAFQKNLAALLTTCNNRLADREFVVTIGTHIHPSVIREAINRFAAAGWSVKRVKNKAPNSLDLRFREKRKASVKGATAGRKKGKKAPPPTELATKP